MYGVSQTTHTGAHSADHSLHILLMYDLYDGAGPYEIAEANIYSSACGQTAKQLAFNICFKECSYPFDVFVVPKSCPLVVFKSRHRSMHASPGEFILPHIYGEKGTHRFYFVSSVGKAVFDRDCMQATPSLE
eukprot:scaffold215976_cov15-Prasinocladus_malaysianus.AAC.1